MFSRFLGKSSTLHSKSVWLLCFPPLVVYASLSTQYSQDHWNQHHFSSWPLLLRLGSWHVQRSCFHRLLAEVRCITVRVHFKKSEYNAGVNITEVAHDIQAQESKYVRETLGLVNSYDTWYGTVTCVCVAMLVPTTCILCVHNNLWHRNKEWLRRWRKSLRAE